jgi:hypothetical protein
VVSRCHGTEKTPGLVLGTDAWSTAQAVAALSLAEGPVPPEVEPLLGYLRETALLGPRGEPGGWGVLPDDTAGCAEVTGWVAMALALAPGATRADRDLARRALLGAQTEDGGIPSVLAAGPAAVRASGTALGLAGLALLEACEQGPVALEPIERAARWLGAHDDYARHAWFPNPRPTFGNRERVAGLGEFASWALLEAQAVLAARGRALPEEARAALADFAASFRAEASLPVTTLGPSYANDYMFELPAGLRSSLQAPRWIWAPWRLLASARLARAGDLPRAADWAAEAERLRARIVELPAALREAPTFELCEFLFGVEALRARPPGDRAAGSAAARLLR